MISTAQATPESQPRPGADPATVYFPRFDWLRITLAMAVLLAHARVFAWEHAGNLAVQVFFALSGWLIGGLLLHTSPADLARFWFNRATRIWIPYAAAAALLLGLAAFRDTITRKWLEFVFYKVTFTYNVFGTGQLARMAEMPLQGTASHFWSICAEEQFYLACPLLLVLAPRRIGRSPLVWGLLSAVAVALNLYGSITLGVLAAILRNRWGAWYLRPAARLAIAAVGVLACTALPSEHYYRVVPFFSLAVVLLLATEGPKSALGAFLGGVSYPLYLNHWTGLFVAHALEKRGFLAAQWLTVAVAVVVSMSHAAGMYWAIDRQVMARRSGWFTPARGWALTAAGFGLVSLGVAGGLLFGS